MKKCIRLLSLLLAFMIAFGQTNVFVLATDSPSDSSAFDNAVPVGSESEAEEPSQELSVPNEGGNTSPEDSFISEPEEPSQESSVSGEGENTSLEDTLTSEPEVPSQEFFVSNGEEDSSLADEFSSESEESSQEAAVSGEEEIPSSEDIYIPEPENPSNPPSDSDDSASDSYASEIPETDTDESTVLSENESAGQTDGSEGTELESTQNGSSAENNNGGKNLEETPEDDSPKDEDPEEKQEDDQEKQSEPVIRQQTLTVVPEVETDTEKVSLDGLLSWMTDSWMTLHGRPMEVEDRASGTTIQISGMLPEGAKATVKVAEAAEEDIYQEIALFGYLITVLDQDGNVYVPESELRIEISSVQIGTALQANKSILIYSDKGINSTPKEIPATEASGTKAAFQTKDNPLRVILTTREPFRRISASSDDTDTVIQITGAFSTSISADVVTEDAGAYQFAGEENLLAVDISMYHNEAEEYQPDEPVAVSVTNTAIEEALGEGDELSLWSIQADGSPERIQTASFADSSVTFYADSISSYVVTRKSLEKTIHASDGSTYYVKVTYDSDAGIPDDAELQVTEILSGTPEYESFQALAADAVGTGSAQISFARFFDITILLNGQEIEPKAPVQVEIYYGGHPNACEDDNLTAVHFGEGGTEILDADVHSLSDQVEVVSFEADSFSVYGVVSHEGGTVLMPRVEFHFIGSGAEPYSDTSTCYVGIPYQFRNKHGDAQTTQILASGESLELIADPANTEDQYFYGWYVVNPYNINGTTDAYGIGAGNQRLYFSWPEHPAQIPFETAIAITERNVSIGDTVHWSIGSVSGSGTVDQDGNVHVFLAPVYEKYNFVNFMQYPRDTVVQGANKLMSRKMIALGSSESAEVKISDVRSPSEDAVHLIFTGWEYNAGTEQNPDWVQIQTVDYFGAEIREPGRDGRYGSFTLADTASIDLYPIFVEARWVDFVSGVSGSGAVYVASRFLQSWGEATPGSTKDEPGKNVFTSLDTSSRAGYDFDGWYAFAVTDPITGEITNLDEPQDVLVRYIDAGNRFEVHSVTVRTTAVKVADNSGNIVNCGTYRIEDNGDGTGVLHNDAGDNVLFQASDDKLRFYDPLDRLTLCANWRPVESQITIVYWTENAQDLGYTVPQNPKDDYTPSAVKTITTTEINQQLHTSYASGTVIRLDELADYKINNVGVLAREYLDDAEAVMAGEEKFYDLNRDLSDASVEIKGDGSTTFNVYFSRMEFSLVFHIGRDGYVKENGQQRAEYMTRPEYSSWDGNWIQFMFKDSRIRDLGYTPGPTAASYGASFSMTYTDPDTGASSTYTSEYATNAANVKGDYVPESGENVYVLTAKYGAYIGDRWPTPVNKNFSFTSDSKHSMYIWAAYYGSLYCGIAHSRTVGGDPNGNNPDINGVYNYMTAELCSNRDGTAIINENRVHHLVAYYGQTGKTGIRKTYHIYYEAIDGTYAPAGGTPVPGADFLGYGQTTWSAASGSVSAVDGHEFYWIRDVEVISNLAPQYQLGSEIDGYELVYSCYNTPKADDHHIYFFYRPKQYTLTFYYENPSDRRTDTYYYTQSLVDAKKSGYDDPEREGYRFLGWYTNEAGIGEPFDFADETMPSANVVLYPILKVLQYTVRIDPNGGVIDHRKNSSQSTYFTADWGVPVGEYSISRSYIKLSGKEQNPNDPIYYDPAVPGQDWYYYVNTQRIGELANGTPGPDGDWGYPPALRNAVYLTREELHDYWLWACGVVADSDPEYWTSIQNLSEEEFIRLFTDYPYRPLRSSEHYTFMGWYPVSADGTMDTMPYNFSDPVTGDLTLRAKWRLDGGYYVQYNPYFLADDGQGGTTLIVGELTQWTDPANPTEQLYADQSVTHVLHAPTNVTEGWVFRGWRVVCRDEATSPVIQNGIPFYSWVPIQADSSGEWIYYQPGDSFLVDSALVTEVPAAGSGAIIHLQAYYEPVDSTYRRPDVTDLILDANDAYGGYVNTTDNSRLPALTGSGSTSINTATELYNGYPTQILFGDIQSNLALHLYRYATAKEYYGVSGANLFSNSNGYFLLGFDEGYNPARLRSNLPYIPTYASDSVAAVTRNETGKVLYATWEPMVYVTFVNTTDEPITLTLTGTGENTVRFVNLVTGEYEREAVDAVPAEITIPAKSGDADGEVRIVLPGAAAGRDSFTATAVNDHLRKKISVSGAFGQTIPYGTGSGPFKYGDSVIYTGILRNDPDGIVVTYTEEEDRQLVFDVNRGTWTEISEDYVHADGDLYTIDEDRILNNAYRPADPIRSGYIFLGWTVNRDIAAHTDFSSAAAATWGETTITPEPGSNVLEKVKSDYLWDFSQTPPFGQTLYAVWSETVTVTFDLVRTGSSLHIWQGPSTTSVQTPYAYYRSSEESGEITYTLAKGDQVPKPKDPSSDPSRADWFFVKWLRNDTSRRNTTKQPNDSVILNKAFDFSQRITENLTLSTSWSAYAPQTFEFTVENHVTGGNEEDEFSYTIAVNDELVLGKLGNSRTNSVGVPDRRWGSFTTTLKNNEQYTVLVTVSHINPGSYDAYSIGIDVIDRDGVVAKSGQVIYCNNNSNKNFVSDYQYALSITQDSKEGYETTVACTGNNHVEKPSTDSENRTFVFTASYGTRKEFKPEINGYAAGESNNLTVVYTNTGAEKEAEAENVAPTGVTTRTAPYALLVILGLFLILAILVWKRRRKEDKD